MPRYSPARTIFSSTNKKLWDLPWEKVHEIYVNARADIVAKKQEKIDSRYQEEIEQLEREYVDSHEAPYEGNFSDSLPKPPVVVTLQEVEDRTSKAIREEFIEFWKLHLHVDWLMPQIITYLGNLPKYLGEEGKYCGLQFRNKNFKTDAEKGLYRFLMVNERSSYLKSMYKAPNKQYCPLVPLILYAHRLKDQTPYSAWSRDTLAFVVNTDLSQAMLCTVPNVTRDELIHIRKVGLMTASGEAKNPLSTHQLYGKEQAASVIGDLPKHAKVMLTQIWCAHPENRTRYMVLNPKNWDKMPPELIASDVVTSNVVAKDTKTIDLNDNF